MGGEVRIRRRSGPVFRQPAGGGPRPGRGREGSCTGAADRTGPQGGPVAPSRFRRPLLRCARARVCLRACPQLARLSEGRRDAAPIIPGRPGSSPLTLQGSMIRWRPAPAAIMLWHRPRRATAEREPALVKEGDLRVGHRADHARGRGRWGRRQPAPGAGKGVDGEDSIDDAGSNLRKRGGGPCAARHDGWA